MNLTHTAAMPSLPPFDSLVAFEAVLRHGSMTAAARELSRTQSAVSHRLRRLEDFMGTPLLLRGSRGLTPTPAGTVLAQGLAELLDGLGDLRARCRAVVAPATLKVGVGAALADQWLVARLPAFLDRHPQVAIDLAIVDNAAQARALSLDVEIVWQPATQARATMTQRLLARETVFPVCHPRLLDGGRALDDPAALATLPILHKGSTADGASGAEWSWPVWFTRLGISTPPPPGLRFANIGTAIASALQGTGVVLARSLLVHDALAQGRLARVLSPHWDMPSSKAHLVRWPAALAGDDRVTSLVDWLLAQAETTLQPAL